MSYTTLSRNSAQRSVVFAPRLLSLPWSASPDTTTSCHRPRLAQYPPYLLSPEALALPAPQLHAYKLQAELVKEIVALFDRPDFKDDDDKMKADVRELMGKVSRAPPRADRRICQETDLALCSA